MKKTLILALALATLLAGSCDFVRVVAGRPTAAKLETMHQEQMKAEQARHQARLDSMKRVQQQMADSLAALESYLLDSLAQANGGALRNPAKLGGLSAERPEAKYYISVGAFRTEEFAKRKARLCEEAGYTALVIGFKGGLKIVAICPSNSLDQTVKTLNKNRGTGIFPKDAWIFFNS